MSPVPQLNRNLFKTAKNKIKFYLDRTHEASTFTLTYDNGIQELKKTVYRPNDYQRKNFKALASFFAEDSSDSDVSND